MGRFFRFVFLFLNLAGLSLHTYAAPDTDTITVPDVQDTARYIAYLNRLSATLIGQGAQEQAVQYASQALELARMSDNDEGEATALLHIGNAYSGKGENKKALSSFIRSLKRKKTEQNRQLSEKLYYNMAVVLARIKKYPQALKYFHKASQLKAQQGPDAEGGGAGYRRRGYGAGYQPAAETGRAAEQRQPEQVPSVRRLPAHQQERNGNRPGYDTAR